MSPGPFAGARVEPLPGLPLPRGQYLGLGGRQGGQRGQREALAPGAQCKATGASGQMHLTQKIKQFLKCTIQVESRRGKT